MKWKTEQVRSLKQTRLKQHKNETRQKAYKANVMLRHGLDSDSRETSRKLDQDWISWGCKEQDTTE